MTWQFWTITTELQTTTTLRIYLKLGLLLESQNLRIRRNPGLTVLDMTKSQCSIGYNEDLSRCASSHLWVQQRQNRKTSCFKVRLGYIARCVSQKQDWGCGWIVLSYMYQRLWIPSSAPRRKKKKDTQIISSLPTLRTKWILQITKPLPPKQSLKWERTFTFTPEVLCFDKKQFTYSLSPKTYRALAEPKSQEM